MSYGQRIAGRRCQFKNGGGGRGKEEKKKRKIVVTFSCSCSAVLPSRRLMKEVDLSSQTLAWFSP